MIVHIDIESRSAIDLKACGAYRYAEDPSTTILFIAWAIGDGVVKSWDWRTPFPDDLRVLFEDDGVIFKAHNAAFERLMFQFVLTRQEGTPVIPISRFYCTATQARANALPDKLELCARALGGREQKDHRGAHLIRQLSVPQPDGSFLEDDALLREFQSYCEQDVRTERDITTYMRDLTPDEMLDYIVGEEINDRGIMVDREFAAAVTTYADEETAQIKREVTKLTYGQVTTPGSPKYVLWLHERLPDEHKHIVESTSNKSGFSFDKDVVDHLYNVWDDLPPKCQQAVTLKAMSAKSSISKFQGMVDRSGDDWRVRGAFVLFGGGQTHRYSSRGLQLHNMARDTHSDPFHLRDLFLDGSINEEDLFRTLKSMVRPSIMPDDGNLLVCIDWSNIEAVVLPWSTGYPQVEPYLDIFRDGRDIYVETAASLPTPERQLGKVTVLSMGYGGGVGAFQAMAKNYGVSIPDSDADSIKEAWRRANPWAPRWWKELENAAKQAMRNPGQMIPAGRVHYVYTASGRQIPGNLWCVLPSGTILCYPQAKLVFNDDWGQFEVHCLKASLRPKKDDPSWPRMNLWGGLLAENVTQAISGDLLREALRRVREWSDEVVLHVHDEIVLEAPESEAAEAYADLEAEMLVLPEWAEGLPLACSGWIGDYYRKE